MTSPVYISQSNVYDYDDVMLVPQECVIESRSQADTTAELGNQTWQIPIIPANMSTVVDENTCEWLASNNYFYIMHRFNVNNKEFIKRMQSKNLPASISVGVKKGDYAEVEELQKEGLQPDYVTIDIAHGDAEPVRKMIRTLRIAFPKAFIIAGNVATVAAAERLAEAGAHAVKVGIAPGSACLTGPNTGFGSRGWQLAAVRQVAEAMERKHLSLGRKVHVIADGGIKHPGDIAKALAFGADFVMLGGMLAGHDENPGQLIATDEGSFKEFFGSASAEQKGESKHVEGKRMLIAYRGSIQDTLTELKQHLQSSISYSGGAELSSLRNAPHVLLR